MADTRKATLLLVDDKEENLFALERILEDSGYVLLQANSGHEALRIVLNQPIDLILLDVQMPEMDGFFVAKLLQGTKKTKDIPIIFLTAINTDAQYQEQGLELGAVNYLTKPIDPDVLKQKITSALKLHTLGSSPKKSSEHL